MMIDCLRDQEASSPCSVTTGQEIKEDLHA